MRVEGQGMAVDYTSAKNEVAYQSLFTKGAKEGGEKKIGLEDLKKETRYTESDLQKATETVNKALKMSNYHLEFRLHEESGRYQVKVVNTDTEETVREIPPENVLEFSAQVRRMLDKMIGLLVDEFV
jgi:flagellar protein FlaG